MLQSAAAQHGFDRDKTAYCIAVFHCCNAITQELSSPSSGNLGHSQIALEEERDQVTEASMESFPPATGRPGP
jgi:hypothetical protein